MPIPTYILADAKNSPQVWEITVYDDDFSKDITKECSFEFVISPPTEIKIVKNRIVIDKKAKSFQSQVLVKNKKNQKLISFSLK